MKLSLVPNVNYMPRYILRNGGGQIYKDFVKDLQLAINKTKEKKEEVEND